MKVHHLKLWLIVPVKPFYEAKSRLSDVLSKDQRAKLSAHLLARTLSIAAATQLFERTVVISRDPAALAIATRCRALPLEEQGRELNAAFTQSCAFAAASGAEAALLLPSDLPRLRSEDLCSLVEPFRRHPSSVVIAPSRDGGTNALLLPLPLPFPFAFGDGSCQEHRRRARAAGCEVCVVDRPALHFDLDTPTDLSEWLGVSPDPIRSAAVRSHLSSLWEHVLRHDLESPANPSAASQQDVQSSPRIPEAGAAENATPRLQLS